MPACCAARPTMLSDSKSPGAGSSAIWAVSHEVAMLAMVYVAACESVYFTTVYPPGTLNAAWYAGAVYMVRAVTRLSKPSTAAEGTVSKPTS